MSILGESKDELQKILLGLEGGKFQLEDKKALTAAFKEIRNMAELELKAMEITLATGPTILENSSVLEFLGEEKVKGWLSDPEKTRADMKKLRGEIKAFNERLESVEKE